MRPHRRAGFTLVELMVTLAIIALLVSIIAPHYTGRILRSEETVLRENLFLMRDALDKHFSDAGRYPEKSRTSIEAQAPRRPLIRSASTRVATPLGILDPRPGLGSSSRPVPQGVEVNGQRHVPRIVSDRPLPARHPAAQWVHRNVRSPRWREFAARAAAPG